MEKTKKTILMGIFISLITISIFIKIPFPLVPISLQSFFTMMAGILLGPYYGPITILIYIFMGLLGLPIFANGGGIFYILKPSFGYLIGFVFGAYISGYFAHKNIEPSFKTLIIGNLIGTLVIYAIAIFYYVLISKFYLGNILSIKTYFVSFFLIFLPGDILKCVIGAIIGQRLLSQINNL